MKLYPVGSRVKVSPESQYYGYSPSNPDDVEGTLLENNRWGSFVYRVEWDNGRFNNYRQSDLLLVNPPKPKGISAFIKRVEKEYAK